MRVAILVLALLGACSPGTRGMLVPVAGADVAIVSTHGLPGDTARLAAGGVTADVTGTWNGANETVVVTYRADSAADIPLVSTATWQGDTAPASGAWDITAPTPGNAVGRPLLDLGQITLVAGTTTRIQIEYARPGHLRPAIGDELAVTVPMPQGARAVRFRFEGE